MKALLILVGGRPIPNILTVIHEKPDVIVAICSKESFKAEWLQLKPAIEKLLPTALIRETNAIGAYDVKSIEAACESALATYPKAEWVVNVTTGTSLMTHGAYVAAERCSRRHFPFWKKIAVECWFLATGHSRVIALLGKGRDASIFHLCVDQYITAYNYRLQDAGNYRNYRSRYVKDDWMTFAQRLGKNLREINLLKQILEKSSSNKWHRTAKSDEIYRFLQEMERLDLIDKLREEGDYLHFYLSDEQHKFLNGAWLELYVFQEAQRTGFFDDMLWSKEIIDNDPARAAKSPYVFKEMDVSLTFKAQLMIVECKTGNRNSAVDDLVAVADLVGRGAVLKVLVASDDRQESVSEDFAAKAKMKGVRLITQEKLPDIGSILKEIAETAEHR